METAQFVAALLAWLVFAGGARAWHMRGSGPSPTAGEGLTARIKRLMGRDPDTDPDPDPEPPRKGFVITDEDDTHSRVVWLSTPRPAPLSGPASADRQERRPLDEWVAESLANGAAYGEIVREGARLHGVSEPTVKRAIARARGRQ